MASGYPGRDLRSSFGFVSGSAVHLRSDGGGGALLKRSLSELERQQQMQHPLYSRSVKQKTMYDLSSSSSSSISSSSGFGFGYGYGYVSNPSSSPYPILVPRAEMESEKKSTTMRNQLQELERQLLDDEDDDNNDVVSVTGSAVTTSEWGEAMQQLLSPSPPLPTTTVIHNSLSPSPTTSSSSTASSSASCSPPNSSTPSRQMLLDTAAAIADGNLETAATNIAVLKRTANPRGDPDQRLTAIMVSALATRTNTNPSAAATPGSINHHPFAALCSLEHQTATQMLYDMSPCFKLGLMAANYAILDATKDHSKIHVVDFDIGQGGQYAALIHAIADRSRQNPSLPAPIVKITAVADPTFPFNTPTTFSSLRLIGDKINKLSDRLGLTVLFKIVNSKTSELNSATLGCEHGEALAVNFSFVLSKIADESVSPTNPRDELLRRVKSLEPNIVTMVEQDINFNTATFSTRFAEACSYYGSLLDSLDAMVGRESLDRARVEACLARKAANSVGREGPDRLERPEVFGKWRARMGMAGLKSVTFGPAVADPVRSKFSSLRSFPGFTLKEEAGGLQVGWIGRAITVASAWR